MRDARRAGIQLAASAMAASSAIATAMVGGSEAVAGAAAPLPPPATSLAKAPAPPMSARPRASDRIGDAVAGDVAGRDAHAAGDVAGRDAHAAGDVAGRDAHAAGERRTERRAGQQLAAIGGTHHAKERGAFTRAGDDDRSRDGAAGWLSDGMCAACKSCGGYCRCARDGHGVRPDDRGQEHERQTEPRPE
jgi:hypothetical protein